MADKPKYIHRCRVWWAGENWAWVCHSCGRFRSREHATFREALFEANAHYSSGGYLPTTYAQVMAGIPCPPRRRWWRRLTGGNR